MYINYWYSIYKKSQAGALYLISLTYMSPQAYCLIKVDILKVIFLLDDWGGKYGAWSYWAP